MQYKDTDRLWISDKRVEKLILDTINGKTPLATNDRLKESAKALEAEVNDLSDYLDFEIETIADYIYALNIITERHTEQIADNAEAIAGLDDRLDTAEDNITSLDGRLDMAEGKITSLETFRDTTVPQTYCTIADYTALEARVRALEEAQPT